MSDCKGLKIQINGVVQGVGFRPFVYDLATGLQLVGWVRNTDAGLEIHVDGPQPALQSFVQALQRQPPPLAHIDEFRVERIDADGFERFEILASSDRSAGFQPVSPDVATCPECLAEVFDPNDRRYRYPFTNCTNCGPRFTIIADLPYDRPATTMKTFPMCSACAKEYGDPGDRRFHAQPVACPACGPQLWLEPDGVAGEEALQAARRILREGRTLAVKGLGGFHLACDACSPDAVRRLRRSKRRLEKPFAVMMANLEIVEQHCTVSESERRLLESRERPIVILHRRSGSPIAEEVAPYQRTLGVMLPYTPLHHLLLEPAPGFPCALVMTSGNFSDEPIAKGNREARTRLANLADSFLLHDREIYIHCDDPVVRVFKRKLQDESLYPLRRSRGYAPSPIRMPWNMPAILATGAELKNTFCLTRENYAFLSHHIGELSNYETLLAFEQAVSHFERLFRTKPSILAYDLHPDYLATRYAVERARAEGLTALGIQHHHAHIAACLAEHGHDGRRPVIGIAFDGSGYGTDETIWGGEFLVSDYARFRRAYHLKPIHLAGGDKAVREPWRLALAWLQAAGLGMDAGCEGLQAIPQRDRTIVLQQLAQGINAPLTSSMGRLFDAVAALIDVRQKVHYEAQAAIELEAMVDPAEAGAYLLEMSDGVIDPTPAILALARDQAAQTPKPVMAARFHNGLVEMVGGVCRAIRREEGLDEVALSGGVWQNLTLLERTVALLEGFGFTVFVHRRVPANDGGLSLGQAVIAYHALK